MLLILALTLATAAPIVSALPLPLSHAESTTVRSLTGPRPFIRSWPVNTLAATSQAPHSLTGTPGAPAQGVEGTGWPDTDDMLGTAGPVLDNIEGTDSVLVDDGAGETSGSFDTRFEVASEAAATLIDTVEAED